MTTTILIAVVVVIALVLFAVRVSKGLSESLDDIELYVRGLLRQGHYGGLLVIDVARSNEFVQLVKYINGPGAYGIELAFPNADWSAEDFPKVIALCESRGVRYRLSRGAGEEDPLDFLYVDFGTDDTAATELVKALLVDVLDVPPDAELHCKLENATPFDILVDGR